MKPRGVGCVRPAVCRVKGGLCSPPSCFFAEPIDPSRAGHYSLYCRPSRFFFFSMIQTVDCRYWYPTSLPAGSAKTGPGVGGLDLFGSCLSLPHGCIVQAGHHDVRSRTVSRRVGGRSRLRQTGTRSSGERRQRAVYGTEGGAAADTGGGGGRCCLFSECRPPPSIDHGSSIDHRSL